MRKLLDENKLKSLIEKPLNVTVFEEVSSTNLYAKNADWVAIFAKRQTEGRGRSGKTFFSGDGGLYFSLSLPLSGGKIKLSGAEILFSPGRLTIAAGIAVAKTLDKHGYVSAIKWVNDVFCYGKKVCGILAERCGDRAVVGMGVNLDSAIPKEFEDVAVSLGYKGDHNEIAAEIINTFFDELVSLDLEFYKRKCITIGKVAQTQTYTGKAVGVADDGALLIETEDGIKKVFYGEVTLRQ